MDDDDWPKSVVETLTNIPEITMAAFGVPTIRSYDGTANNLANPSWGAAGVRLLLGTSRWQATIAYGDGVSVPAGLARLSARQISNMICRQSQPLPNDRNLSSFVWAFGQFLSHDIHFFGTAEPMESLDIPVPAGDPIFPVGSVIPFARSTYDVSTGSDRSNPRQQLNLIGAYIDGSGVYGSDETRAAALRLFDGTGRLKTSSGNLLPLNDFGLPNEQGTGSDLFLAGDVRANAIIALTAIHTLFVREHNRLSGEIAVQHPQLSNEQIYQRARKFVGAKIQVIAYKEYLPALMGPNAPGAYPGYDATLNASLSNVFSGAGFRDGHSQVSPELLIVRDDGSIQHLLTKEGFVNPGLVQREGIEAILRGLALVPMSEIDTMVIDDLRNFAIGAQGAIPFDLLAIDLQRGRDHGVADYNQTRVDFGLEPANTFADVTSDVNLQNQLSTVYGDVNNIDLLIGIFAEDHLPDSSFGELITTVQREQWERLRAGDRFWYENDPAFSEDEKRELRSTTLKDVIRRNTTVDNLRDNVFLLENARSRM